MKKNAFILPLLLILLALNVRNVQAQTETPTPTETATPTPTETPTATPTITETPMPSNTPTITNTPTPTRTPIPEVGGGGSTVNFPWEAGKQMYFGTLGVHGNGEFGTVGMYFVDWVGGSQYGPNSAGPNMYASADGTIDYICQDSYAMGFRTNGTNPMFYLHLNRSAPVSFGDELSKADPIGTLRGGDFCTGNPRPAGCQCGYADNTPTSYHIHWGFKPSNGYFCAEGWCLNIASQVWTKGSDQVRVGGWMTGGGGIGSYVDFYDDPASIAERGDRLFDSLIAGLVLIVAKTAEAILPEHQTGSIIPFSIVNGAVVTIRIFYILLKTNFNMVLPLAIVGYIFITSIGWTLYSGWRLILKIIPAAQ